MGHLGFCVIQNINGNLLKISPNTLYQSLGFFLYAQDKT